MRAFWIRFFLEGGALRPGEALPKAYVRGGSGAAVLRSGSTGGRQIAKVSGRLGLSGNSSAHAAGKRRAARPFPTCGSWPRGSQVEESRPVSIW